MCSDFSRFHTNRSTFGGVIAERVNAVETRRKVNPVFGWSIALSCLNDKFDQHRVKSVFRTKRCTACQKSCKLVEVLWICGVARQTVASALGFWPACIGIRIMSQHCTIATWRDIYYTHCKGLTVLDYFYFPLSLHHYCCIIRVSLRQETGCFGEWRQWTVDVLVLWSEIYCLLIKSVVWHICHEVLRQVL